MSSHVSPSAVPPIVIVGGGITGLTAAYRLQQLAPALPVVLVEREARPGGKIQTERHDGFLLESGPDCFLSRKPQATALCRELGLLDRLQGRIPENKQTYVLKGDALHLLPEGLSGMIPTQMDALQDSTLFSAAGKARLARERDIPPRPLDPVDDDESLAAFIVRRFGQEAYDHLIEPLMSGIYAGQGERLSLNATFPALRALELKYGSLLDGLNAKAAATVDELPPFVSLPGGMEMLVRTMLQACPTLDVRTQTSVTDIAADDEGGYTLRLRTRPDGGVTETLRAAGVVVAVPGPVAAPLLSGLDADLAEAVGAIPYASTALVSLAFEREPLKDVMKGYGYVIPRVEKREALACTWTSEKWQGRAPDDRVLVRLYLGRAGEDDITTVNDERLLAIARDELLRTFAIACSPLFSRIHRWPDAIPQYNLGHRERVARVQSRMRLHRNLFLAGAMFEGVGIPDCIGQGDKAAHAVLEALQKPADT